MAEKKKKTNLKQKEEKVKVAGLKGGQRIKAVATETMEKSEGSPQIQQGEKKPKSRGKRYQEAKKRVDPDKFYSIKEAVELVKQTSISKFIGKLEAHLVVSRTGEIGELKLPYLQTRQKKVVIADEGVLEQIKSGKLDFDVLLTSPKFMPKLLPYARVLGPKGLMPNPKNGTLTDNPEKIIKKIQEAGIKIKTEKSAPVIHLVLGNLSQKDEELIENVKALIETIGKPNIKKMVLAATMGPGVKVQI